MKTKAAILTKQKSPLEIWELEIPPLRRGQVLVRIAYSGICHSQLNEINGMKGEDPFIPHTLGHEGSGIVQAVGEGVTKVKEGDSVVLSWIKGEGIEAGGSHYASSFGKVNSGPISTFMETAIVSENRLVPIPQEMPLKEAALLGCAIPTGAGVVLNEMQLKAGNSLAVFGVGGVGLSAIVAAAFLKADPIIAVDVHEEKLRQAKAMGATLTINATKQDPGVAIKEMTSGLGVDFVFESAGKKEVMETAFCCLKAPGLCVLAGNLPKGQQILIDPFELIKGKRIVGTWGGKSSIDKDIARYVELFLKGAFPLEGIITHMSGLEGINDLFSELAQGRVGRALLEL